jgi:phosphohistidine phosphatase
MKALHLLRHAKSSWDDPSLDDFERPLAPRGRRAARKVGRYLRTSGTHPALVLCSPARRTRDTLELLGPAGGEMRFDRALYGASAEELTAVLRALPGEVPSVLLIGHNPGLQQLAIQLAGDGDEGHLERMREKMPTGALASLELVGGWGELTVGAGRLVDYVVPKEL